jgi:Ca2+-binding EF-hand superfamily protein
VALSQIEMMMHALGFEVGSYEISKCLSTIRSSNGGNYDLNFDEFVEIAAPLLQTRDASQELKNLYELFDEDQTGISFNNLKRLAKDVNLDISDNILREMITAADNDEDGLLCLDDFEAVMRSCSRP